MRDTDVVDVQDVPDDGAEPSVGERLREARSAAGLTLEQVSATTRIRVPVLRDLEADRLGPSASAVYTRGHIRAIAAVVGVDPAPIVRVFDEHVGATAPSLPVVVEPVPAPRAPTGSLSVPVPAPPDRTQPRWLAASLAGVTVLVALLAIGTWGGDPERERAVTRSQVVSTPSPTPTGATASAGPTAPAGTAAPAVLDLRATGRSWLSVRNRGGAELFAGVVDAGWSRRFEDPVALTVRIGNAAAIASSCGGAPVPPGQEGEPVTLRCVPGGPARR